MEQNKFPLKEKLKCPICNFEFIPKSFHFEKTHFDAIESKGELMSFQNAKHQLVVKPFTSFRGSWVTYCPECGYLIRFAAEIGKKEITEEHSRLIKRGTFEEFGKSHKYDFHERVKPYMDQSDYFIEKVDNIKRKIKDALDKINFNHWGAPYKEWKTDKNVDTFKFLIRFYTNLKDYTNSQVENYNNKEMPEKIRELNLPSMLVELLGDILKLHEKLIHNVYQLNEEEEDLVEKTFIQFMYYIVGKQLKPLNLNKIEIKPEHNFIDKVEVYYQIREFLHLYLHSTLYIEEFDNKFFTPLLEKLEIPMV